jgi:hypothetical protein
MTYVPKTNIVTKPKTPAALAKLKDFNVWK